MGLGTIKIPFQYVTRANCLTSRAAVTHGPLVSGAGRYAASTVAYVAEASAEPAVTAGVASVAVRDLLRGIRRNGRVLAALPQAIYLEFADPVPEPRVITVSPPDAIRLPNA